MRVKQFTLKKQEAGNHKTNLYAKLKLDKEPALYKLLHNIDLGFTEPFIQEPALATRPRSALCLQSANLTKTSSPWLQHLFKSNPLAEALAADVRCLHPYSNN